MALVLVAILSLTVFAACTPKKQNNATNGVIDIYAINDFHGTVDNMPRVAGYLAARKKEGAIILNSGDMFQGSMESNSNYGKLLTDCMAVAGFDEMTFGNHEFDWGLDNLRTLSQESGVPFLGANIYNWDRETGWGEFADDLADEYIIKQLSNGIKVGVIGVIGQDQITSISSQLVQTIGFKDPLPIIRELSTELREQEDCDVVVVSAHAGPQDIVGEAEDYKEPSTTADLEKYVDAVFCAHTHAEQNYLVNGLPFLQGKRYGDYVSHLKLQLNNGNVEIKVQENVPYSKLKDVDTQVENKVENLINNSNIKIEEERNQVLAKLNGGLNSATAIPRLVCNAIADYAEQQGYTIDLAIVNNARNSLSAGEVTYSDLYEAIPFDNVVYIAKVSGAEIIKEMGYSGQSMWRVSGRAIENKKTTYYYAAIIDYLLYHQNSNRNYNYFPSAFESGFEPIPLTKEGVQSYNYRLITRDFLLKKQNINADLYTKSNVNTDASKLQSAVDLPVVPYTYETSAANVETTSANSGFAFNVYAIVPDLFAEGSLQRQW